MRVRLLGDMSGTRDGQQWPPRGSTVDLPDDEALHMIRNRMATPVVDEPVETAVVEPDVEARVVTTDSAAALVRKSRTK